MTDSNQLAAIRIQSGQRLSRLSTRNRGATLLARAMGLVSLLAVFAPLPAQALSEPPEQLTIAHSSAWTPYAFLNAEGEPAGMLIDLWRLFGEKQNVDINFELVDWRDSMELVRTGQADVHGGLTISNEREDIFDFSREIVRIRTLLFIPAAAIDEDLAEMGEKPVGVVASTFDQDFIETHFPHVKIVTFPNSEAMVNAALRGDLHAFVADYPSGYYRLLLVDAIDKFRAVDTLYTESIHVAVANGNADLLAFIDSGFRKITEADLERIRTRWLIPSEPIPSWIVPLGLAVTGLLLAAAFGAHYTSLRRAVRQRTEDLNTSVRELESANAELSRLSRIDPLTGIANRRSFYEKVTEEMKRARRYGKPISLMLIDLDDFKKLNDHYGHVAGDAVLRNVAEGLRDKLRESDVVARYGGDEFVALLPETNQSDGLELARRILDDIRVQAVPPSGERIEVGLSAGIAEFADDACIDDWIQRADAQLYKSKAAGTGNIRSD